MKANNALVLREELERETICFLAKISFCCISSRVLKKNKYDKNSFFFNRIEICHFYTLVSIKHNIF